MGSPKHDWPLTNRVPEANQVVWEKNTEDNKPAADFGTDSMMCHTFGLKSYRQTVTIDSTSTGKAD